MKYINMILNSISEYGFYWTIRQLYRIIYTKIFGMFLKKKITRIIKKNFSVTSIKILPHKITRINLIRYSIDLDFCRGVFSIQFYDTVSHKLWGKRYKLWKDIDYCDYKLHLWDKHNFNLYLSDCLYVISNKEKI